MNNGFKRVINNGQLNYEYKKCDINKTQGTHSKEHFKCQNSIKIAVMVLIRLTEEKFLEDSHLFFFLVSVALDITQAYQQ